MAMRLQLRNRPMPCEKKGDLDKFKFKRVALTSEVTVLAFTKLTGRQMRQQCADREATAVKL